MSSELDTWLDAQGLGQYAAVFRENEVDLDALALLGEADLVEIGIPLGPRKKLVRAIGTLRPAAVGPASAPLAPDAYTPGHLAQKILTSRAALEGERKQVTVLFCDIADSTALALRAGAESMHGILNRFFQLALDEIHRYEGTVNQFLGDGFMALFGAPLAHEDHARRAVLAAVGIRQALDRRIADPGLPSGARLAVRIGLHTGPVVVGSIGDNLRMDYTAVGDTTHLAARLQQAGSPDQVLMSEATERLVRGYVTSQPLAPLALKGIPEPVVAYEVGSVGSRRSRLDDSRALSPFVGRERELGVLREALADAEQGRGQVVGVVGEPGVGKSRLLLEFRRLLQLRDVTYLEGWCLSFGHATPYLPLQDVLRTACGIAASDSPAQIGVRVRSILQQAGLPPDELAAYVLQALAVNEGTESLAQVSPETVKARTLDTLLRLVLAHSGRRMLVLAIEDLHWIDRTSEEFLSRLIESIAGARILLVTTSRPGYTPPWLSHSYVTQVPVRVLPSESARRIVDAATDGAPLPESTKALILGKGEGNPFFLEELSLALSERGGLDPTQHLPDTIQGVIAARIDRLAEPAKRVLQTASVLGREFPLQLLEAVMDSPEAVRSQLSDLQQLEFFYQRLDVDRTLYLFKHALTQDVAYESLLTSRREALHEAAGRAIEALYPGRLEEHYEVLAHHYAHSGNTEKAIEYLDHANLKALRANAVEDAQGYFNEALRQYGRLVETNERKRSRVALMVRQAPVFMLQMKMLEYEQLLRGALAEAESIGDDGLLGRFLACLGHCLWFSARYEEAIATNLRAAELAERSGVLDGAGHGLMLVQWSYLYAGAFPKVLEIEPHTLSALDRAPHLRYRVWSLTASAQACASMGRWSMASERNHRAMKDGEAVSDVSLVAFGAWMQALTYVQQGRLDDAIKYASLSVEKAPTLGDKAWGSNILLWASARKSVDESVVARLEENWRLFQSTGFKGLIALSGVILAEGQLGAGRHRDALATARAVRELCEACGQRFWQGVALRFEAEAELNNDARRIEHARAALETAIALLRECAAEPDLAHTYAVYGRMWGASGNPEPARDYLSRADEIYRRLDMSYGPDRLKRDLAQLDASGS